MESLRFLRSLTLVSLFFLALPALAQQQTADNAAKSSSGPTLTVHVKEVNLIATVRDKKGQMINNLGKQDFVLEQDGRPQTITQFALQNDASFTFGILADTGPGQRKTLADERKAATEFVKRAVREGKDKAFVLHFDKDVELLQDVTTHQDKLAKGIDQISVGEQRNPGSSSGNGRHRDEGDPNHPHFFFGGSTLYDAIFLSADDVLKNQLGRKAVVLFSDGQDRESRTSLEHAIEAAQRSDMIVYCAYVESEHEQETGMHRGGGGSYPGGGYPGGGGPFPGGGGQGPFPGGGRRRTPEEQPHEDKNAGKKVLQRIAKETGGKYFEVSKKMTAEQIYSQIEDELHHQYSLSYTPDKVENGYHKLHLSTKNSDLSVQTREGFYSE